METVFGLLYDCEQQDREVDLYALHRDLTLPRDTAPDILEEVNRDVGWAPEQEVEGLDLEHYYEYENEIEVSEPADDDDNALFAPIVGAVGDEGLDFDDEFLEATGLSPETWAREYLEPFQQALRSRREVDEHAEVTEADREGDDHHDGEEVFGISPDGLAASETLDANTGGDTEPEIQ